MSTEKYANRIILFLFAVTSSSAISAQLVVEKKNHSEKLVTVTGVEGNCGEEKK